MPSFSVVINTYNRVDSLRATLDALRQQTFTDFEVVVVDGPSDDGTSDLLSGRSDAVRVVRFEERNLSKSRNLGIDAAAGEVVAFIDDDAIPEPRWLEDLASAFEDPEIGGAGGVTLDNTGVRTQYRYSLCDRMGRTDFGAQPPFDAKTTPGANPFLYLQGTNCSFRRDALAAVDGFDEEIEYNYDESEVCAQIIDSGRPLRALDRAIVHHKFLPSHMRRTVGFTDPFFAIKNRVYFALRMGRDFYSRPEILRSLTTYIDEVRAWADAAVARRELTAPEREYFNRRVDEGFALGLERGVDGARRGRRIAAACDSAFLPYPTVDGRDRLSVCFITLDYPPKPVGGISRFTGELARGFARAGHETHLVTRDDDGPLRTELEDGVWVHRFPVAERWIPELADHPLKANLDHLAAVNSTVQRIAQAGAIDVVAGSLWIAEPLLCALDPRLRTAVACNTPMAKIAELQPETASAALTDHQINLESALLRSPAHLQPVSHENAKLCRALTDRPLETIWHGVQDRRAAHLRDRADDGIVILFVGRLEPRKGIDTLLEAAAPLLRRRPDVRLRIVGADNPHAYGRSGVSEEWVRQHAADVSDRIEFAGVLDDDALFSSYANCDVFCAPSRYESFGLVHVEAMMMGRPVVACGVGGMLETVLDGVTGALVPPDDAVALDAVLDRLVCDSDLRESWGAAGRARYEAEFSLDVAVERNVAFYRRVAIAPAASGDHVANTAAILSDLCGLDASGAEAAAQSVLDPSRFPVDPEGPLRRAFDLHHDRDFVDAAFRAILGRAPEAEGAAGWIARVGAESRLAVVRAIIASDEARSLEIPPGILNRLPEIDATEVMRNLRKASLDESPEAFTMALAELADGAPDEWRDRLERGASKSELVADLIARPAVARRIAGPGRIQPDTVLDLRSLVRRLRGARGDANFVDLTYRLVLGRAADAPGGQSFVRMLNHGLPRATVVYEIASSVEARSRGFSDTLALQLSAAMARRRPRFRRRRDAGSTGIHPTAAVAERLDYMAEAHAQDRAALVAGLAEVASANSEAARALQALQQQTDVLARKYEALALDFRERVPSPTNPHSSEPEILRPDALASASGLRINVGAGEKPLPGYINIDARRLPGIDVVADAARLPFDSGSIDEIASHHLIEHFRQHYAQTVLLPYWRSLLRKDGVLRLVTPNWAVLIEQLQAGRLTFTQFKQVTFGLQDYSGDDHFALYTPQTLRSLLEAAGFERVEVLAERRQNGLSPELEMTARPRSA